MDSEYTLCSRHSCQTYTYANLYTENSDIISSVAVPCHLVPTNVKAFTRKLQFICVKIQPPPNDGRHNTKNVRRKWCRDANRKYGFISGATATESTLSVDIYSQHIFHYAVAQPPSVRSTFVRKSIWISSFFHVAIPSKQNNFFLCHSRAHTVLPQATHKCPNWCSNEILIVSCVYLLFAIPCHLSIVRSCRYCW